MCDEFVPTAGQNYPTPQSGTQVEQGTNHRKLVMPSRDELSGNGPILARGCGILNAKGSGFSTMSEPLSLNQGQAVQIATNLKQILPITPLMHLYSFADQLRARMPRPIWDCFRKMSNAVLAPLHFSLETGHLRSSLASRAMDRHGNPLPWFTYPAIQLLLNKDLSRRKVLEWGAGQSTFFWATRAEAVTSFESAPNWHAWLQRRIPKNVALHLVREDIADTESILEDQCYDLVVCDGLDRYKCAERSIGLLSPDGAIIIDNSEGNNGPRPGFGFLQRYKEAGFARVDFFGYPPGNTIQQTYSL